MDESFDMSTEEDVLDWDLEERDRWLEKNDRPDYEPELEPEVVVT